MNKNYILDTAIGIKGFKHIEGVIEAINTKSALMASEDKSIQDGLWLILLEIEDDITLQRDTWYQTMLNVRNQYALRNRHNHTALQMNAITLAIAHVRDCMKLKRLRKQVALVK
ncbi:hypothetical protein PY093_11125 [Cytobacillus sp. S13-E01]|uniref:hypothetical protein n=1 Tax=Cytobacillus sp. S13-E01 TaxID=3031326 RepID=UPI0023D7FDDD|nr:hypothetical protein [Cytobacillus sp. S13-E01]MDF0727250.1 hypothetical protein [Cytobacillus sp. S13-E01]